MNAKKVSDQGASGEAGAHARLSPSSMERWSQCAASIRMSEGIPSTTSSYAAEGTRMHEVCSQYLVKGTWPEGMSEEENDHCRVYVNYILDLVKQTRGKLFVEEHISAVKVDKDVEGTADAIVYDYKNSKLIIVDFKYGQGIAVEAKGNKQMRTYALATLLTFENFRVDEIEMVIVQPRAYHEAGPIRSETISAFDLMEFSAELKKYADATRDPKAKAVTGDHCRFCPAAGICPELAKQTTALAESKFGPSLPYKPDELAHVLDKLPLLEDWIKSVREFAFAEMNAGKMIPHWKLVPKRAYRKWRDESQAIENLEAVGYGQLDYMETKLKSPAQIEKLLGTRNKAILEPLVVAESSGFTLAPESDKREAVNRQSVAIAAFAGSQSSTIN